MTTVEAPPKPAAFSDNQRVLPHDIAAERSLIGAMLLSPQAIDVALDRVSVLDFYDTRNATVFAIAGRLHNTHRPVDAVTVTAELIEENPRFQPGPYIHDLVSGTPMAAHAGYYARIVAERALLRRLVATGIRIAEIGYGAAGLDDAAEQAQKLLHEATATRRTGDYGMWADLVMPAIDEIEEAKQRGGRMLGVRTGLYDLDQITNGLQAGQLVVVAGRPGMGKSVLLADLARACAFVAGLPAGFISLEMSTSELMTRILSAETGIALNTLKTGRLTEHHEKNISDCLARTGDKPLAIVDIPGINLNGIRTQARRIHQKHGKLGLLAVDYLQLLTTERRGVDRHIEVAEISRGLKLLARELECPVVAAAQLNRASEARADKRPHLSDLRESGSIEQDADVVLLLHREDYYNRETEQAGQIEIHVAKNRNGPTDTVIANSQLHVSRIVGGSLQDPPPIN